VRSIVKGEILIEDSLLSIYLTTEILTIAILSFVIFFVISKYLKSKLNSLLFLTIPLFAFVLCHLLMVFDSVDKTIDSRILMESYIVECIAFIIISITLLLPSWADRNRMVGAVAVAAAAVVILPVVNMLLEGSAFKFEMAKEVTFGLVDATVFLLFFFMVFVEAKAKVEQRFIAGAVVVLFFIKTLFSISSRVMLCVSYVNLNVYQGNYAALYLIEHGLFIAALILIGYLVLGTGPKYRLERGVNYIVKEKKPEESFEIFADLVSHGIKGLCITRMNPDIVRKKFGIEKSVPVYWLSKIEGEHSLEPTNVRLMVNTIEKFVNENQYGVVLLDGLEYLISFNDFTTLVKVVEDVCEIVSAKKSNFILPINPSALGEKETARLERNMEILAVSPP